MTKRHVWLGALAVAAMTATACSGGGDADGDATPGENAETGASGIAAKADKKAPSAPQPVAGATRTSITLSWAASTDNVGVAGYDVYLDGKLVATTQATSYADPDVVCATTRSYSVDAFDAAGNHSAATPVSAVTHPCIGSWTGALDFFVQDVCLDASGAVVKGIGPMDGDPRCVQTRDLQPGELLPYHKTGTSHGKTLDEFPVDTGNPAAGGVIAMKSKGNPDGSYEIGDGPANIYLRSAKTIASYMTLDGNGPTYHVSSTCSGGVPLLDSLFDTKIRIDVDALNANRGLATTYGKMFEKVYEPSTSCPTQYPHGDKNAWFFENYSYPLPGGGTTPPLQTLVSDDDDPDSDTDHHLEVYYQTRELGRTRYEAYQNVAGQSQEYKDRYYAQHDKLVKDGTCNPLALAPPPSGDGSEWVEFECEVYTSSIPPIAANGDSIQPWVDMAKASNMSSVIWGLAPSDDPVATSISPSTIPWGYSGPITITGRHFGDNAWFTDVDVMFGGGSIHVVTPVQSHTQITFTIPPGQWDGSRKSHLLKCGKDGNAVHVYDGVSLARYANGVDLTMQVTGCPE